MAGGARQSGGRQRDRLAGGGAEVYTDRQMDRRTGWQMRVWIQVVVVCGAKVVPAARQTDGGQTDT
jgi:hypothetical protein